MHDARRSLARLSWSLALTWLSVTMLAAPGPAAWVALSGRASQAGAYFTLVSLASALGAALGGRAMERWGRRPALVAADLVAAAGFAVAGLAYASRSLALFAVGTALASAAVGAVYLTRLAAGEIAPPATRGRAVARVQVAATAGAVLGPFLLVPLVPVGDALGVRGDLLLWAIAPVAFTLAAALVASARALRGPMPHAARSISHEPIPRAPFIAGVAALVCAQAAMVTVMGVTGVELRHAGHSAGATASVMALHFVGMFGLSLVVGRIADRVGRARAIASGLGLVAAGGFSVAFAPGAPGLAAGLLLVGLGWSFAYIAGTVLLTDVIPAARRARVLGSVDATTALLSAAGSFAGGIWYAQRGIGGLGLAAAALVALPLVLVLAQRAAAGRARPA